MKPTRSLKARALQLLAQREQSQVELRRKLLACLKADEVRAAREAAGAVDARSAMGVVESGTSRDRAADAESQVQAVLDWLAEHQFASDERFAESRVRSRSARYGNLRIRQELKQHAVALTPAALQTLDESEEARAAAVYQRRYPTLPETAAERAKRARFLIARGFSPEVVRRVLRRGGARGVAGEAAG